MNQGRNTISDGNNGNRSNAQTNLQQETINNDGNSSSNNFDQLSSMNQNTDFHQNNNDNISTTKLQVTHHHHRHQHHSSSPPPTSTGMADPNHVSTHSHWPESSPTDRTNSKRKANENDSSTNRPQAAFINKLYKILEDDSVQHLITWSEKGDLFCVSNPNAFSKIVLPQYFKHNNWQSFVRQLNMYGFHKVNDMIHSNLASESQKWEFKHQNFRRGAIDELQNIKRKSAKSHHQYLTSSITGSPLSTSSMGRLLLGDYPQRQQQHQKDNDYSNTYRRGDKLVVIKGYNNNNSSSNNNSSNNNNSSSSSSSNKTSSNNNSNRGRTKSDEQSSSLVPSSSSSSSASSTQEYQYDSLYQHVMQMEDRIIQITQSHESLKIETGELKSILTRRNSVMEEITNLLLALASENNKITNLETVETIKKNMLGLREAMRSGFQTKERSSLLPLGPSRSTSTSPYLSSSDYDNNNNNNSRRSSIIRFNNNDSQYNNKSGDDRNKSGVTDAYRNDDGRQEGMPISSILSGSPPSTKQYEETEPRRSRRLPSIDVVCTEPFQAGDPPSPHYRLHHRSQEQQHFSSPSSPTSPSMADLDRPIPPLKPLRPLRSLLKVGDTRHHSRNSVDNLTPLGAKEPRSSSAYMRLGKESPLLNPGPSSRPEQPLYDYNETNDAKRSRPDHQVG